MQLPFVALFPLVDNGSTHGTNRVRRQKILQSGGHPRGIIDPR